MLCPFFRAPILHTLLLALVVMPTAVVLGDRITLKDGTVLDGTAIKQGDGYWFKGGDGQSRHVAGSEIQKVESGSHDAPSAATSPGSAMEKGKVKPKTPMTYQQAERRAN